MSCYRPKKCSFTYPNTARVHLQFMAAQVDNGLYVFISNFLERSFFLKEHRHIARVSSFCRSNKKGNVVETKRRRNVKGKKGEKHNGRSGLKYIEKDNLPRQRFCSRSKDNALQYNDGNEK